MKKCVGMLAGTLCLALVGQSAGSVLIDPDFEANDLTLGWDFPNYGTALVAETGPSSAPGDSLCVGINLTNSTAHYAQAVAKAFPVELGKDYKLTLDYKQPAGSSGEILVQVRFWDGVAPGGYNEWPAPGLPNHQGDFNMILPESVGAWSTVNSGVINNIYPGATHMDMRVLMNELGVSTVGIVLADNIELIAVDPLTNMLSNPGFETEGSGGPEDPDGWDRSSTDFVKRSEESGQTGHGDWMVNFDDSPSGNLWAFQTFPITAGDEFVASAQFKAFFNVGESVSVDLVWLDAGSTEISSNSATYAVGDGDYVQWGWVTRSVTAMAPVGTTQVRMQMTSHLAGGGNSALFGDNAVLYFLGSHPMVPATILSWTAVSNDVMKMVVDAPGSAPLYHPEATTDLAIGTWANVPHSATAGGTYVATNLSYSTTDATGTNEVIYIQTTDVKKFFNIVGPE